MSSYKGHLLGGFTTFLIVQQVSTTMFAQPRLGTKEILFAVSFCLLGSLFPDIDIKSFGQKIFYNLLAVLLLAAILAHQWGLLSVLSLISIFPLLVKHRGIIHTVGFVMLVPVALPLIIQYNSPGLAHMAWLCYLYFTTGALSHLLLDRGIWRTVTKFFRNKS